MLTNLFVSVPFLSSLLEGFYRPLPVIALLLVVYPIFASWHRKRKVFQLTAMNDLVTLGRPRTSGRKIDGTAVVAGGSISGLMAARVCATHFSRVIVVEPEEWTLTGKGLSSQPSQPSSNGQKINERTRVPQYTSIHAYLAFSYLAVKEMFPDIDVEATKIDPSAIGPCDYKFHVGGRLLRTPYEAYGAGLPKFVSLSRAAYEPLIRKLVIKHCDNVEFVNGIVSGINMDVDGPGGGTGNRIQSVRIRDKKGVETTEPALLLIDCTGPTCAGMKWVSTGPNPVKVAKVTYDPKMYYTTAEYRADPAAMAKIAIPGGWENARAIYNYLPDSRMDRRTFLCMKREDNILHLSCGGFDFPARTRSIEDVRNFMKSLKTLVPVPSHVFGLCDALEASGAEKNATYSDIRIPACHWVKYHDVIDQLPTNFIAIGDSVMRVNPVRGQGCTIAAVEVATLSRVLDGCTPIVPSNSSHEMLPQQFAKIYWERQLSRVEPTWEQGKVEDYAWDTTIPIEGETRDFGSFARWYGSNLLAVGWKNPSVTKTMYATAMFLAPGSDVLTPSIAIRVLFAGLKEYLGWTKLGV